MAKESKGKGTKKQTTQIQKKGRGQAEPSKTPVPTKVSKPPDPPKK